MIPLLDTHQHLLYPERYTYAWTQSIPALTGRDFRYDDYLGAAEGCGIAGAVFMEATGDDPARHDETAFASTLVAASGGRMLGIVAACRPESENFAASLEAFGDVPVVGLRRILHVEPDGVSRDPRFRANLRLLAAHGLTFDLCVLARQLPLAYELAASCPEVAFVLDHCGVPDVAAGGLDPWRADLTRLAELPNVTCKVSGVLAYCDPARADLAAVRPYVEHSIEAFGWDRVVWGSDWPLVEITSSLSAWASISRALVAAEPEENQRKLFHANAERVYGVEVQHG